MWKISRLNLSDKLIYKTLTEPLSVEVMDLQNVETNDFRGGGLTKFPFAQEISIFLSYCKVTLAGSQTSSTSSTPQH